MIRLFLLTLLITSCSTPASAAPSPLNNLAVKAYDVSANLQMSQEQTDRAQQAYIDTQREVIAATSDAQSIKDVYAAQVTATSDALGAAVAQRAATATAQSIDVAQQATAGAVVMQATREAVAVKQIQAAQQVEASSTSAAQSINTTRTAIAVVAMATATAQVGYERMTAFDAEAQRNKADQQRAQESYDFQARGMEVVLAALAVIGLTSLALILRSTIENKRIIETRIGIFERCRLPSGQTFLRPLQIAAPREEPEDEEEPAEGEFIPATADGGTTWQQIPHRRTNPKEEAARQAAILLLNAAWKQEGQSSNRIPGYRSLAGWETLSGKWTAGRNAIADYIEAKTGAGNGTRITSTEYPSLYALLKAVTDRHANIRTE
jgi:hypothetical protein